MTNPLFTPVTLGALALPNRIVMAPLTRSRAGPGDVPPPMAAEYYRQRASAGLIITEATQISNEGKGYMATPGIYSAAQVDGWRRVADAVHAEGGRIVMQLWHVGAISHVSLQEGGRPPVSPSGLRMNSRTFIESGFEPTSEPRALERDEIPRVVEDYRAAARNARDAGFDGVEIHAANNYLIDQFLRTGTNRRTDDYGGPVENRVRFLREVAEAVVSVWGADRVGIRLSPLSGNVDDADRMETFGAAIAAAGRLGLAYLHMVEGMVRTDETHGRDELAELRTRFPGRYVANNRYDRARAMATIESGAADAVAFGRPFIANPDLVRRLELDAPLNTPDDTTFYGGDARGYLDYPTLRDDARAVA